MLPTGLAIIGVSQKALNQCNDLICRFVFDFKDMMKFNEMGYFPYTPAVTILRGLRASIDMMLDEGLDNIALRHHHLATGVRIAVSAWGLDCCAQDEKWYSDTVTAVKVKDGYDAKAVINSAYYDYNISLGGGLNILEGKVFRIGHLGWLNEAMVTQSLSGVELAMKTVGIPFKAGSGVGAAVEFFSATKMAQNQIAAE